MRVKTIKPHFNGYGDEWGKTANDEYDVPEEDVRALIESGKVEEVNEEAEDRVAERKSLEKLKVEELDAIIEDEEIVVEDGSNKSVKIDAIIAGRDASLANAE